ncbi:hypothetical protein BDV09DRAFT_147869 [Aspergillus tetrazonus]
MLLRLASRGMVNDLVPCPLLLMLDHPDLVNGMDAPSRATAAQWVSSSAPGFEITAGPQTRRRPSNISWSRQGRSLLTMNPAKVMIDALPSRVHSLT